MHSRAELLTLDPTLQRTFDPYAFIRDAWLQQREFEIFDGNPPPETLEEEFQDERERQPEAAPETTEPQLRVEAAGYFLRAGAARGASSLLPPIRSSTSLMRASASICAGTLAN